MELRRKIALEIARAQYLKDTEGYPLRQLFWECTQRCNFACRHCGSDCKAVSHTKDMPWEDFRSVLQNIKDNYPEYDKVCINVTGGEPLARPDLCQCGLEMYRMGFPWGLVTNAWLLDEAMFVRLLRAGLHSLTISLDGIGGTHDWMRGRNGSFERVLKATEMICHFNNACARGEGALAWEKLNKQDAVKFDIVTCVNKRSLGELPQIRKLLIEFGVTHWRLFTIFPVGRAAEDPELQLDKQEYRQMMEFISASRKEGGIDVEFACEGFLGRYEGEVRNRFFSCNAGVVIASVLADGKISACASIRSDYSQGDIYHDKFWDVWTKRYGQFRDRSWMRTDKCARCSYWRWCQGGGMHLRDSEGKLILCHIDRAED